MCDIMVNLVGEERADPPSNALVIYRQYGVVSCRQLSIPDFCRLGALAFGVDPNTFASVADPAARPENKTCFVHVNHPDTTELVVS